MLPAGVVVLPLALPLRPLIVIAHLRIGLGPEEAVLIELTGGDVLVAAAIVIAATLFIFIFPLFSKIISSLFISNFRSLENPVYMELEFAVF